MVMKRGGRIWAAAASEAAPSLLQLAVADAASWSASSAPARRGAAESRPRRCRAACWRPKAERRLRCRRPAAAAAIIGRLVLEQAPLQPRQRLVACVGPSARRWHDSLRGRQRVVNFSERVHDACPLFQESVLRVLRSAVRKTVNPLPTKMQSNRSAKHIATQ